MQNILELIDDIIKNIDSHLRTIQIDKIFQIGFNKCGTRSMAEWLESNSIRSVHWVPEPTKEQRDLYKFRSYINTNRTIGGQMYHNHLNQKQLLHNLDQYTFYGDFGVYLQNYQDYDLLFLNRDSSEKICIYKLLMEQFPNNSVYILNIRNVNKWLRSRYLHYKDDYFPLDTLKKAVHIEDNAELVLSWKKLWYDYICGVLEYFDRNNMMHRLLIYNLDTDTVEKFIAFFKPYGIRLVIENAHHRVGKSKAEGDRAKEWDAILQQHSILRDKKSNEYENIINECYKRDIELNHFVVPLSV